MNKAILCLIISIDCLRMFSRTMITSNSVLSIGRLVTTSNSIAAVATVMATPEMLRWIKNPVYVQTGLIGHEAGFADRIPPADICPEMWNKFWRRPVSEVGELREILSNPALCLTKEECVGEMYITFREFARQIEEFPTLQHALLMNDPNFTTFCLESLFEEHGYMEPHYVSNFVNKYGVKVVDSRKLLNKGHVEPIQPLENACAAMRVYLGGKHDSE